MNITKSKGRYNLCSTEEDWNVAIRFPDGAPFAGISEMWPLDNEPDIEDVPPSEVIELISERVESHLVSTSRAHNREIIAWARKQADKLDAAWAESEITRLEKRRTRLAERIDTLRWMIPQEEPSE